jgi:hypothetical protein
MNDLKRMIDSGLPVTWGTIWLGRRGPWVLQTGIVSSEEVVSYAADRLVCGTPDHEMLVADLASTDAWDSDHIERMLWRLASLDRFDRATETLKWEVVLLRKLLNVVGHLQSKPPLCEHILYVPSVPSEALIPIDESYSLAVTLLHGFGYAERFHGCMSIMEDFQRFVTDKLGRCRNVMWNAVILRYFADNDKEDALKVLFALLEESEIRGWLHGLFPGTTMESPQKE